MCEKGFDSEKYLAEQSAAILERAGKFGDKLYIEGKIRTTTFEDQSGIRRYRTEIQADNMEMLSYKSAGGQSTEGK